MPTSGTQNPQNSPLMNSFLSLSPLLFLSFLSFLERRASGIARALGAHGRSARSGKQTTVHAYLDCVLQSVACLGL